MKRFLLTILAVLTAWLGVAGTGRLDPNTGSTDPVPVTQVLTVSSAEGHPGDTVDVVISATLTSVTAVQLDIPLGHDIRFARGSEWIEESRSDGHAISATRLGDEAGTLRLLIYNMQLAPLKGDGRLCGFRVVLGDSSAVVSIAPTAILSDVQGGKTTAKVSAGTIRIIGPEPPPPVVNVLRMQSAEGSSGEEVDVRVSMRNMDTIAAVQFSIVLPEGLAYVDASAVSRHPSHTALASVGGDVLKVMMYSAADAFIEPQDGELVSFKLKLLARSGSYALEPTDVVLGNKYLDNVFTSATGASIEVKSPHAEIPATLDWGLQRVDTVSTAILEVKNSGKETLTVTSADASADAFTVLSSFPIVIAPGASGQIEVACQPSAEGMSTAVLNVYTDDPDNRLVAVQMSIDAYAPNAIILSADVDRASLSGTLTFALNNYSDIAAWQAELRTAAGITILTDSLRGTVRTAGHTLALAALPEGGYRIFAYSIAGSTIASGDGAICTLPFRASGASSLTGTLFRLSSIQLSDAAGVDKSSLKEVVLALTPGDDPVDPTPSIYDVNGDGAVDIADVVHVISLYLKGEYSASCDLDSDGEIDITDAVIVISHISK